jgi:hypothetical protein
LVSERDQGWQVREMRSVKRLTQDLAQLYQDAPGADYRTNPLAYEVTERTVTAADRLALALAPEGGAAIRFKARSVIESRSGIQRVATDGVHPPPRRGLAALGMINPRVVA